MQSVLCTYRGMSQSEVFFNWFDSTTSQIIGPVWGTAHKMVTNDILFHLFPTFAPPPHGLKITRLRKIYISTCKSSLSEVNFIPIWRNTLGHILLDKMSDSLSWFIILTDIIYSNPSPYMVVPFILFLLHWKSQCQAKESKRGQTATKKFQAQRKA